MQYLELHEQAEHGTTAFPFEFHHLDQNHPRYIMNYHWHAEYELIRILEGELDMTLDERHIRVKKGELVFVHGGILHSGMPVNCVYECLIFDILALTKYTPGSLYLQKLVDQSARINDHFTASQTSVIDRILPAFRAMDLREAGFELTLLGSLFHFFGGIFSDHLYMETAPLPRKGYRHVVQLKNVLEYIDANFSSTITLDQLASAAHMSPKYFCRFFQQMTSRTPMDYLNYQRIEHACYELASTETSVTDVALNCGFNDLSYFIKTFKRYKGVTPGRYKEKAEPPSL